MTWPQSGCGHQRMCRLHCIFIQKNYHAHTYTILYSSIHNNSSNTNMIFGSRRQVPKSQSSSSSSCCSWNQFSKKIPKAFLIRSGAHGNFAHIRTDIPQRSTASDFYINFSFLIKFVSYYWSKTWHWTFTNTAAACCSLWSCSSMCCAACSTLHGVANSDEYLCTGRAYRKQIVQ